MKRLDEVKSSFDSMDDYDAMIARAIPDYDRMVEALMKIAEGLVWPKQILELGIGTGLVARRLLRAFPKARLTAIDFAPTMIANASKRLSRFKSRTELVEGDFYDTPFPPRQDLVISALAIHHLDDIQKAQLFEKIHTCLVDDGLFVNADCAAAVSDRFSDLQQGCWIDAMERQGVPRDQIIKTMGDHEHYDVPATIDDQIGWLDRAGFVEVECLWRDFGFAVIAAVK